MQYIIVVTLHVVNSVQLHKYPNTMMNTYTMWGTGVLLVVCKGLHLGIYRDLLSVPPETRLTCRCDCREVALEWDPRRCWAPTAFDVHYVAGVLSALTPQQPTRR